MQTGLFSLALNYFRALTATKNQLWVELGFHIHVFTSIHIQIVMELQGAILLTKWNNATNIYACG